MSRTPLSAHAGSLRTSLLLSLGLVPLACGGTALVSSGDGGSGGAAQAGASAFGGTAPHAGTGSGGGPIEGGAPPFAGTGGVSSVCPEPVYDAITKLWVCNNGLVHRQESVECTYVPGAGGAPDEIAGSGGGAGAPTVSHCQSDADCAGVPNGYCELGGDVQPVCKSGCVRDSDCGSGACSCNGINPGRCVTAGCLTDADCGPNSLCAVANWICGSSSFQCTRADDECITTGDCGSRGFICAFQDGHRVCSNAICGRPFMVADAPRTAAIETRADWLDPAIAPDFSNLSAVERAQLAAHWAGLGQMEHASIAAFARFSLQLLSLGAPSDLIEACHRALADETAHARTCFAFASAYGGMPVGPAPLDIDRCFEDTSLTAIAKLVLREGCLGETVAALEALAIADAASDLAVKQALTRIAGEELEHAQLAFRFLAWALTCSSPEQCHELAREAAQQLADFESEARGRESTRSNARLAAHGLVESDVLRTIHLAAARDVARPLLAALFDMPEARTRVAP